MSFVPTHLQWLDRQPDFGWPDWMDKDAREWLTARVRALLTEHGPQKLMTLYRWATDTCQETDVPECLREARLWDALLGVMHRALCNADAEQLWHLPPYHWRDRISARHDDPALRKLLDPYRSDEGRRWQPVGTHDDGLLYDHGAIVVRLDADSSRWRCYQAGEPLKDARGRVRSWALPSAACKAGLVLLAEQAAGKLGVVVA